MSHSGYLKSYLAGSTTVRPRSRDAMNLVSTVLPTVPAISPRCTQKHCWPAETARTGSRSQKCSWVLRPKDGRSPQNTRAMLTVLKRVKVDHLPELCYVINGHICTDCCMYEYHNVFCLETKPEKLASICSFILIQHGRYSITIISAEQLSNKKSSLELHSVR